LWSRYEAGTETGTVSFSKVETGTIKNSYGSTTLVTYIYSNMENTQVPARLKEDIFG
jgi:hypothetical protein